MKKTTTATLVFLCATIGAINQVQGQNKETASQASARALAYYGVTIEPDKRLIVMMAALDAAGFEPTSAGGSTSVFRQQIRKDQADLDPDLKYRMHEFYEHNRMRPTSNLKPTPADEVARYISLALALGTPPQFESPSHPEDLPSELLEVLDFAPLLREFYRRSGIEQRLGGYYKLYQAEGDNLSKPAQYLVRDVVNYLHTQPNTKRIEHIQTTSPGSGKVKKDAPKAYSSIEHDRHFYIVPDLLAVPASINFRGIGDDYYVIVPFEADLNSADVRRAYLQYVIDPLVLRYNRDIAQRRDQIKVLLADRTKAGADVSPDVFLAVSRSLVVAAYARMEEVEKLSALDEHTKADLVAASKSKDPATARAEINRNHIALQKAADDEMAAQLSDAYEKGAILAFFFAEQLKGGVESSGFDIGTSLADMVASFDPVREETRLKENAEARDRAIAARKARADAAARANASRDDEPGGEGRRALVTELSEVEEILRVKNYTEAESRLKTMLVKYQREPRIFFLLGQAASLSAQDAFDENLQTERLKNAVFNYTTAIQFASTDSDKPLISRAHAAIGRILIFQDKPQDALKEFDAVIALGADADPVALRDAQARKQALGAPK